MGSTETSPLCFGIKRNKGDVSIAERQVLIPYPNLSDGDSKVKDWFTTGRIHANVKQFDRIEFGNIALQCGRTVQGTGKEYSRFVAGALKFERTGMGFIKEFSRTLPNSGRIIAGSINLGRQVAGNVSYDLGRVTANSIQFSRITPNSANQSPAHIRRLAEFHNLIHQLSITPGGFKLLLEMHDFLLAEPRKPEHCSNL